MKNGSEALSRVTVVYESLVGSTIHNLHIEGQDDRDQLGIFIEDADAAIGFSTVSTINQRTQPDGVRSGPGDLDRTLHSLRKFCHLALKGNPTIILLFFVPQEHICVETSITQQIQLLAPAFASMRVVNSFLGYLENQRKRMTGEQGQKRVNRPELVAAHGYDTKYAMHAARLGCQGVEFARTGEISLPMPSVDREACMAIRRGEWNQEKALAFILQTEQELLQLRSENPTSLSKEPCQAVVENWMVATYLEAWTDV